MFIENGPLEVGQEVWLCSEYDKGVYSSKGVITKVSRKYVTITSNRAGGFRDGFQFDIESGYAKSEYARSWFLTDVGRDRLDRRKAANEYLQENLLERYASVTKRSVSTEMLEAIVALMESK